MDPQLDPDDLAACADQCCAECGEWCADDEEFCDGCIEAHLEEHAAEEAAERKQRDKEDADTKRDQEIDDRLTGQDAYALHEKWGWIDD
jgi:hypothetical protein